MITFEHLQILVTQVIEIAHEQTEPTIAFVEENDEELILWSVGGPVFKLSLDSGGEVLTVHVDLGDVPQGRGEFVHETLLQLCYMWRSLPLKPALADGQVVIISHYPTDEMQPYELWQALLELRQIAENLLPLFNDDQEEPGQTSPIEDNQLLTDHALRV